MKNDVLNGSTLTLKTLLINPVRPLDQDHLYVAMMRTRKTVKRRTEVITRQPEITPIKTRATKALRKRRSTTNTNRGRVRGQDRTTIIIEAGVKRAASPLNADLPDHRACLPRERKNMAIITKKKCAIGLDLEIEIIEVEDNEAEWPPLAFMMMTTEDLENVTGIIATEEKT